MRTKLLQIREHLSSTHHTCVLLLLKCEEMAFTKVNFRVLGLHMKGFGFNKNFRLRSGIFSL